MSGWSLGALSDALRESSQRSRREEIEMTIALGEPHAEYVEHGYRRCYWRTQGGIVSYRMYVNDGQDGKKLRVIDRHSRMEFTDDFVNFLATLIRRGL
jgi:hypothetical protein